MAAFKEMTGEKFGRWTVLEFSHSEQKRGSLGNNYFWIVECSCEHQTRRAVNGEMLRKGRSTSCGCKGRETRRARQEAGRSPKMRGHSQTVLDDQGESIYLEEWMLQWVQMPWGGTEPGLLAEYEEMRNG